MICIPVTSFVCNNICSHIGSEPQLNYRTTVEAEGEVMAMSN